MNRQGQIEHFLLAAHRLALSRLREAPTRIEEARRLLSQWRKLSHPTRPDRYWDEWERLLNADTDTLERAVGGSGDHPSALRSVFPLGVLLTRQERTELLEQARCHES